MSYFKSIPLSGKFGKGKFAKVSNRHYEEVNKITWSLGSDKRVGGSVNGVRTYLSIYVWFLEHNVYPDQIVDHINNKDLLDNTIENLRLATSAQNRANSALIDTNRSGCKYVSFYPLNQKWRVRVSKYCRYFNTIDEAVTDAEKASLEKNGIYTNCETDEVRLIISRKFDIQRNLNHDLNYTEFFDDEIAAVPSLPNTEEDSPHFKEIKEIWEVAQHSGLYKQIFMTGLQAKKGEFVIVDAKHHEILSNSRITLQGQSPYKHVNGVAIQLYLYILRDLMGQSPANDTDTVDHKDRRHWHCIEMNLRYATARQQAANQGLKSSNSSGLKGVSWKDNKWVATIKIDGHDCKLGSFVKQNYAVFMYDVAATLHFGERAATNYEFRKATSAFDFGEESITLNDLEEILLTIIRPHMLTNRDKYLPSLVPYLQQQVQEMKRKIAPKRSAVEAQLPEINFDLNYSEFCTVEMEKVPLVSNTEEDSTASQQPLNQGLKSSNTSGFRGVRLRYNKWRANINISGHECSLGAFVKQKYAIFVYDVAAKLHFGKYCVSNYQIRNAANEYDFGKESITLNDLEEILLTLTRTDVIPIRDIYLPSLIPYLTDQVQEMKMKIAPKRSALDAQLLKMNRGA